MHIVVEIVGWVAAALILSAYALLTAGRLEARSSAYQWMNLGGAAGFILNSGWNGAIPSAALNVIWAGIAGFALVTLHRARSQHPFPANSPEQSVAKRDG